MPAKKLPGSSSDTATERDASDTPSAPEIESAEMVLTYDKNSGQVIRIEKIDPDQGRQELTEEEYASFFGYDSGGSEASGYDPNMLALASAHQQAGFEQGYYLGLMEYEAALTGQSASGYSPEEEAAYYQGVADYQAMVSGQ